MQTVVVLSLMKYTGDQLDKLAAVSPRLEVYQLTGAAFDAIPAELRSRVEVLYGWGSQLDQAHRFPRLKWIQTHSAGVDNLLDTPLWRSNVFITSMNGIHAVPMAEHTLLLMLALRRNLNTMVRFQSRSEWPAGRWDYFARPELRGSTLGLVGYGAIAREVARLAHALGMRVLASNRSGQRQPYRGFKIPGVGDPEAQIPEHIYSPDRLGDMLPHCDFVVVLAPLTPQTRHLFNTAAFARMKPSAFFLNLARGGLVDEPALIDALQQGRIAGAALDVFAQEPLPANSPLWQMEQVIVSPHVSGFTLHYDDRASDLFAENLRRYLSGEPLLNLVEREKGY